MSDDLEHGITPRLPTDPAYWSGLSRRIVSNEAALLDEFQSWTPWWGPLARPAPLIGAAALAAMLLIWFALPAAVESAPATSQVATALAPPDPIAHGFVVEQTPPEISILLPLQEETPR